MTVEMLIAVLSLIYQSILLEIWFYNRNLMDYMVINIFMKSNKTTRCLQLFLEFRLCALCRTQKQFSMARDKEYNTILETLIRS